MPAFTQPFLTGLRGTVHDVPNGKCVTPPENGSATLEIVLINEQFTTMRAAAGAPVGFTVNATAHTLLSDPNTAVLPNGVGFTIGAQAYAGVIDAATGELQISQAGQ